MAGLVGATGEALGQLRRAHLALIDESPINLTITRETKIRERGGFRTETATYGPYRCRVYLKGGGPTTSTPVQGQLETNRAWALLAPPMADLKDGPLIDDEFDAAPWGHFKIENVIPAMFMGVIFGYQADLHRIR